MKTGTLRTGTHSRRMTGNIAVFAHGHILRALAIRWVRLPIEDAGRLGLDTGSLGRLGFEHDSIDQPAIELWNERPS